jgi:hypothetical protein
MGVHLLPPSLPELYQLDEAGDGIGRPDNLETTLPQGPYDKPTLLCDRADNQGQPMHKDAMI